MDSIVLMECWEDPDLVIAGGVSPVDSVAVVSL